MRTLEQLKVMDLDGVLACCREWRTEGATIVHCHGCFDPLHLGHVFYLKAAKALGNYLVVTVTDDEYVDKGPGRPRFTARLRAKAVAELECVDAVTVCPDEIAPVDVIRPHIYVKGAEYADAPTGKLRLEMSLVEHYGGEVKFISGEAVYSSTALLASAQCLTPTS